jgi:hypothetical protein
MEYYSLGGHVDTQVYFDAGGQSWYRSASYEAGWQAWREYITSANIGSQSVSFATTAGSITGQANSATITAATAATANTIVLRDVNGDIYSRYSFSSYVNTSDNDEAGITRFVIKNGDNYHRSATTTVAADIIRGVASGSWGINITGNAATITNQANSATIAASVAATANTIALRDAQGDITVRELIMNVAVQNFTPSSLVAIFPTTNQAVKVDAPGARAFLNVPTRTGGDASGTWGINITGSAGSAGSASTANLVIGTSGGAIQTWDIRTISPSSMVAGRMGFGFTSWTNNNTAPWADFLHLRSYTDGSGGNDNLVVFLKSSIGMRIYQQAWGSGTAYSTFKDIAFTDGTNSSGIWEISVTGNAATATNVAYSGLTGTVPTWNQNTTGSAATLTTARTLTIGGTGKTFNGSANVAWSLNEIGVPSKTGEGASGTWGISITGNAATATNVAYSGLTGTVPTWNQNTTGNAATATEVVRTVAAGSDANLVSATIADNDFFRIRTGGPSNAGFVEIATADDSNEPIYVRQYTGTFTSLTRTATILDGSGNTSFPGNISAANLSGTNTGDQTNISGSATSLNSGNFISRNGETNYNTSFEATPAGTARYIGDVANGANSPGNTWWVVQNFRHSNASNFWGTQIAWGWEDNTNRLATRNVTGGSYGAWVYYLNSANFNSYAPTLTGNGASGSWGISITGNANTVGGYSSSQLWRSDGGIWNPGANITLGQTANGQEWSFDITRNGFTGGLWHVWDSALSTMLGVDAVTGKVSAPYNFVGNLEGNAATATSANSIQGVLPGQIVYGGASSRQGVNQISNWNQDTFASAAFLSSEGSTTNAPTTDFTYGVQTSFHRDSPNYRTQFVTSLYGNNVYWLRQLRDSAGWSSWVQVLHSGNFNAYAPTLTGGGATGTWAINISGNANSATNAGNSNTVANLNPPLFFNNMGQPHTAYTNANNVDDFGARYLNQPLTNGPNTGSSQYYGFTLGLGADYAFSDYASQFYWGRFGNNPYVSVRFKEGASGWSAWSKIWAGYADSAGSVAWTNVSGRPTALSAFTNDTGFISNASDTFTSTAKVIDIVTLTEAEYTSLSPKVSSTLYVVV